MIVLFRRETVRIFLRRERGAPRLGLLQIAKHGGPVHVFLQAQVDARSGCGIQDVVALVLRVVHAEMLLDVLGERMHLKGEIAPSDRVEEIEADGKFIAETARARHRRAGRAAGRNTRSSDGISNRRSPKPSSRLFSSGTPSKHQP